MVETYLTDQLVIKGNPSLDDYRRTDSASFQDVIDECWGDVVSDLIDMGLDVKRIYKKLSLQTSVTKTAAFTGTLSDEDYANRRRLLISVTTLTGTAVIKLSGTDDSTYYEIETYTITETGNYNYRISKLYKKYRLDLVSVGTTITYSSDLIEDSFTDLHRDLTRSRIYEDLWSSQNETSYNDKADMYRKRYEQRLNTLKFSYDSDDSGDIVEDEGENKITQRIKFMP